MDSAAPPASPLDRVMTSFLLFAGEQANGYVGTASQLQAAAVAIDVPEALIEGIFTSARTRGLLEPDFNARGRTRWVVSRRGHAFLDHHRPT